MKKITTVTIASAVMLMLIGCGETTGESASLELSTTAIGAEESTGIDNSSDTESGSEEAGADSSLAGETYEASEDAEQETNSELTSDQFNYKGNTISILDSNDRILSNLGAFNTELTVTSDIQSMYVYGEAEITYNAMKKDGKEYPYILDIETDTVSTSRGIKVGSSKDDVLNAYEEAEEGKDGMISCSFDGFDIMFITENDKVVAINYKNLATASDFDDMD
ncbi:hypothetical protein D6853_08580 [Butyrivibrio sp. X503]|uniref:hypothetical protein n=1 Tax=Butyrivibrio sp. X503 TaxID=2364878 RepID=UPI000EA98918|nr:hypothetical protein [Butyrivibrio sp. X503]RKM55601.1 hypothetical protein D6853_08580 [Butyrivibrio sp. X503]